MVFTFLNGWGKRGMFHDTWKFYEIQIPVPINKALLAHSHAHSFTYRLWLPASLPQQNRGLAREIVWPTKPKSLKKKSADPALVWCCMIHPTLPPPRAPAHPGGPKVPARGRGSRAQTGPGTGGPQSSPSEPRWLRDSSSLETLRSQCASFERPSCPCAMLPGPQETVLS